MANFDLKSISDALKAIALGISALTGNVSSILSLVQLIQQNTHDGASQTELDVVLTDVGLANGYLTSPLYGLAHIEATIVAYQSALLAAIGSPQQVGSPVTLPTTPPTGYGAPTTSDIGLAVWSYATGFPSGDTLAALSEIRYGVVQRDVASAGYPLGNFPGWWIEGPFWNSIRTPNPGHNVFALDFSTILSTDATPDAWVEREYSAANWFTPFNGYPILLGDDHFRYFLPWLTQPEFDLIKATLFPRGIGGAPVWPGIAAVTLGTPVALSPTCVVTGPMHGVIIDITSAAPRQVYQVFGGMQGYRFVGGLQFVDDNGEAERIQSIGMQHEVIVCKSMAKAASCSIRTDSAVTGTATPFVIT